MSLYRVGMRVKVCLYFAELNVESMGVGIDKK